MGQGLPVSMRTPVEDKEAITIEAKGGLKMALLTTAGDSSRRVRE